MSESRWYVVQSYSGHEKKVKRFIDRKIEEGHTEILETLVPTQEVMEIRNGKRVQVERRLYPGYVLVNIEVGDDLTLDPVTMYAINDIKGVIKFVGGGRKPQPLSEEEVRKLLGIETEEEKEARAEVPFQIGQAVEVTQGPFTDFSGTVQSVDADKGKVKVEVSLFGRPTSVELDFAQLKGY
ncbi:MAG: transcription termination/antitermination protein NusG [Gammaproteobacteria bacterium]|nr:transcription termination/antitermination protein NusG [Gammaproteobacteria bacterium]